MNEFLTVVLLHLFAVMSPGPDFFLISRQSIRHGRGVALWSAGGIGIGILFHSLLAVTGILVLISSNALFILILKLICSAYLLYLGITSFFNASDFNQTNISDNKWNKAGGFIAGLLTNITNIKAFLFFVTLFSVVLDNQNKQSLILYGAYMSIATFLWFPCVSYIFTSDIFKNKFLNFFKIFEKFLGISLVIIATQILLTEYPSL